MTVDVVQGLGRERHSLHAADLLERRHILALQRFGMQAHLARMAVDHLMDKMGELHHLRVVSAAVEIAVHLLLVLVEVARDDAHGLLVVDDGGVGGHKLMGKEEARAEAVDVAHEHLLHAVVVAYRSVDALKHATRRTVGECQAEHVGERHTLPVGQAHALAEDLRLTAAGRGKHKMKATIGLQHLTLALVGDKTDILHDSVFIRSVCMQR